MKTNTEKGGRKIKQIIIRRTLIIRRRRIRRTRGIIIKPILRK